jgi:hypothetical protein
VFPLRYEHHLYIKVQLYPKQAVEARSCVSFEVRTSSTYKSKTIPVTGSVDP